MSFEGDVRCKTSPIGFVIYLDEKDYAKLSEVDKPEEISSAGMVLNGEEVPLELRGKIVAINSGGEITGIPTRDDLAETEAHEMKHVLYQNYFKGTSFEQDTPIINMFLSKAKDEIIAHVANNKLHIPLRSQHVNFWQTYLDGKEDDLWEIGNFSPETKAQYYHAYRDQLVQTAEQVRTYQWVQRQLYAAVERGENGLTAEKAEALLRLTSVDQASRLGSYFGIDPENVKTKEKEESQTLQKNFSDKIETIVIGQQKVDGDVKAEPDEWMKEFDSMQGFAYSYPHEAIPGLLHSITNSNNKLIVGMSMTLMQYVFIDNGHTIPMSLLYEIRSALESSAKSQDAFGLDDLRNELIEFVDRERVDFIHSKPPNLDQ